MYKLTAKRDGEPSIIFVNKSLMVIMASLPKDAEVIGLTFINGRSETKLF